VTTEKEAASLKSSIIGEMQTDAVDVGQDKDNSYKMPWLMEPETSIGEIFQAQSEYMAAVDLGIDVTKEGDGGSKEYQLELRPVNYDGKYITSVGSPLAQLNFSVANDLEKYRQPDGSFKFPLVSFLEKGKFYYLTINNIKVNVDKFNFLTLRGSKDDNSYANGTAAIRKGKVMTSIDGDLFFKIYGARYTTSGDARILPGAIISDIGKGAGSYNYRGSGMVTDTLDVFSSSGHIDFDTDKKIVYGQVGKDSNFVYEFYTVYPIKKINFNAQQAQEGWTKTKVFYSFNNTDWQEIPNAIVDNLQTYNFDITNNGLNNRFYVKITYDPAYTGKGKNYGLRDMTITGQLSIK
jgi:hypothetical protein